MNFMHIERKVLGVILKGGQKEGTGAGGDRGGLILKLIIILQRSV